MYDAIVIGSGPNGLAAAIRLAQEGKSVKVYEASSTIGGGMRTLELTQKGIRHDICSAIHPMAVASPYLSTLPLEEYGLEWIYPEIPLGHPYKAAESVYLYRSIEKTARQFSPRSAKAYADLMTPLADHRQSLLAHILTYPKIPTNPIRLARFGYYAIRSAEGLAGKLWDDPKAKALFAGMAAHSFLPLQQPASSAIGMVLALLGHAVGWPVAKGGSQHIAAAMAGYLESLGGAIETGKEINSLNEVEEARYYLLDVTPKQLIEITGDDQSERYLNRLRKFRYGPGVFKLDAVLNGPVPWSDPALNRTATVHLGGTMEEISRSEHEMFHGREAREPYVLLAQQSLVDPQRTPDERHTLWAYCHVPGGSEADMSERILGQIERYAPGTRQRILGMRTHNTKHMEAYNPNYIGGDINGGLQSWNQVFTRPVAKVTPYATSHPRIYLCSSSTPPGGGVHGMCGFNAAEALLRKMR